MIGYDNLAYCYSHGRGVAQNSHHAQTALLQILNHLDPSTQELFLLSFAKRGIKEVESFIENHPKVQLILAEGYLNGKYELPLNEEKAFHLFQKAARANHPQGFENLVYCYSKGIGTPQDSKKPFQRYKG
ncbi:MAG: sel1 repeat family protein [Parachlamydiaceae bacterium]|nr:MAG: sel1 repeat family protein [Parachlamydiaceae bacterium]